MAWISKQFRLDGGLNEEDPQFTLKPGNLAFARNFECLPGGGYKRCGGYEKYDGSTTYIPDVVYTKVLFTNGLRAPSAGAEIIADGSLSTAVVAGWELTSGNWSSGTAAGTIAVVAWTGTGIAGDLLQDLTTGLTYATFASGPTVAEIDDASYREWTAAARTIYRNVVAEVPGTGPVLGTFIFGAYVYAWRATLADSTKQKLYRAVAGTWTEVVPHSYVPYDTGTVAILVGDAVVGGTSGATGTVIDISIAEGNVAGPTYASGRLFLSGGTGVWQNNEEIRVGGVKRALVNGTETTPSPSSGTMLARHKIVTNNFYGKDDRFALYGIDSYNDAYTFDGTNLMYFSNTMPTYPTQIETHAGHLFLAYPGGSVQNSATGLPLSWSVRFGAAEIGIGDDPTGMTSNGNNTLAITADRSVFILTGTSDLDWNLRSIANDSGSIENAMQSVAGQTLFLDRSAVSTVLPAPPAYQDYTTQQISREVRKTVVAKATTAVCSLSLQTKSQYRIFFSDKSLLVGTFYGGKLVGWSVFQYAHQATCAVSGALSGVLRSFMGCDDGFVYELDVGPSFAGEYITSVAQLPFSYHGYPDRDKRFHKITLEMETPRTIDLRLRLDFDYGTGSQTGNFTTSTGATGGIWDASHWEQFFWDSGQLTAPETNVDGIGRNVGITLYHSNDGDEAFILSAVFLQFSLYGIKR